MTTKRKRVETTAPVRRLHWNQLVNRKEPIPGPWPDSRFVIHTANLRRGTVLASLMDASRPAGVGATFIGLDNEGEGLCINKGKGDKYQRILREASKILNGTPILNDGFTYSTIGIAKGQKEIQTIIGEKSVGIKALWVWGPSSLKIGSSKLLKAHSKVITWSGTAPCVFKAPSEKLHGLIF